MLVYDVVHVVEPGCVSSYKSGRWLVSHAATYDEASAMASRYNQTRLVDGQLYRVEEHDEMSPNRAPTMAMVRDSQAIEPTFYDHATNHVNAAEASGIARARRTAIEEGRDYKVVACWKGGQPFWWNGARYDALGLAKSMLYNNAEYVTLTDFNGDLVDIKNARY